MLLGGAALIGDHLWMIGKHDLLQSAADAAAIAATFELRRRPDSETDAQVEAALQPLAERYARFNLLGSTTQELEPEDIEVTLDIDRAAGTVAVSVKADVVDALFAKWLYGYEASGKLTTRAGAERDTTKTEVVLAMDVTLSMVDNLAGDYPDPGELSRVEITRQAARVLVDVLDPGDTESMIAVGVVPWHINVRLNETMRTAWEREGWAVYPSSKTYPQPCRADSPPPAETWAMPSKPEDWQGCLDQRTLTGRRPPGLSAALPARALHDGLLSRDGQHQLPVPRSLRGRLHGPFQPGLLSRADAREVHTQQARGGGPLSGWLEPLPVPDHASDHV